jgi:hypothetical protein
VLTALPSGEIGKKQAIMDLFGWRTVETRSLKKYMPAESFGAVDK